jgi:hypothetical protein
MRKNKFTHMEFFSTAKLIQFLIRFSFLFDRRTDSKVLSVVHWGPINNTSFHVPGHVFGGAEGVRSHFHVLRFRTHFRRFRGRRVPFSCFALPDTFSAVPRATGPVFMFCVPALVFGGTESVGSCFHVLRARTHFRRYRWRPVPFSCFALPDSF